MLTRRAESDRFSPALGQNEMDWFKYLTLPPNAFQYVGTDYCPQINFL